MSGTIEKRGYFEILRQEIPSVVQTDSTMTKEEGGEETGIEGVNPGTVRDREIERKRVREI